MDFEVSAYPVELGGRVLGLATWQDITQRKRAEAALRRSENLLQTLMQHSREVVQILDPQGNLKYTSANVGRL
ncbi:PAS domain-containing protein, partial [Acinetobacter baumannii]